MTPADFVDPLRPEDHFHQAAAVRASLLAPRHPDTYARRPTVAPINRAYGALVATLAAVEQHRAGQEDPRL